MLMIPKHWGVSLHKLQVTVVLLPNYNYLQAIQLTLIYYKFVNITYPL